MVVQDNLLFFLLRQIGLATCFLSEGAIISVVTQSIAAGLAEVLSQNLRLQGAAGGGGILRPERHGEESFFFGLIVGMILSNCRRAGCPAFFTPLALTPAAFFP